MSRLLPKRLIEVDLPIKRISAHARREKSIRHGHISTLHIWWARRPLAACRAVICAAVWPDPVDPNCPPAFLAAAKKVMMDWTDHEHLILLSIESRSRFEKARQSPGHFDDLLELRHALLDFIADFANWDNSTAREYLETSRTLTQAAHEALGGAPGTRPLVVDPFAGGGSIPLEALRVGADTFASDLNPVPILLNKVVLEVIPKFGARLPDEVRKWGAWIKEQAEQEIAKFYPADADGANPIAYLWARTVLSEAPDDGSGIPVEIPLVRSFWLAKRDKGSIALRWVRNAAGKVVTDVVDVRYSHGRVTKVRRPRLEIFSPENEKEVPPGTVVRGAASCPVSGHTTPVTSVREQLKLRRGATDDARLLCVVTSRTNESGRVYRLPSKVDIEATKSATEELARRIKADPHLVPNERISFNELRRISVPLYGMMTWGDVFTARQNLMLSTLSKFARIAGKELPYIPSLLIGRQADSCSSLVTWTAGGEFQGHTYQRQALSMVWDFAEISPFADGSGNWDGAVEWIARVCAQQFHSGVATVQRASATNHPLPDAAAELLATDPPYYDAVPYAYLSDFFYVWHKRSLADGQNEDHRDEAVPKEQEIVVDRPHTLSQSRKDIVFYETELQKAFAEARRFVKPDGAGIIVFASKTTSSWEAILQAVLQAGWIVTASWPIDTERAARISAKDQARLGSSIHIVVRPRPTLKQDSTENDIGDWRDVLEDLPKRIHEWMPRLAHEGVVGADAIFACLGPALEIYSRYARVEKANGDQVTLREYLEHVWAAVSREALSSLITGSDLSALEADARITAMWLWTLNAGKTRADSSENAGDETDDEQDDDGGDKKPTSKGGFLLEYDAARKIAQGLGASLEDLKSVIEISGDQARLLPVSERTAHLFGNDQATAPEPAKRGRKKVKQMDLFAELVGVEATEAETAWEEKTVSKPGATVLDRVHQSMILFATGRGDALKRFLVDDGIGQEANFWKLAQALSALYPASAQEKRWVDGVLARKKGLGL